MKTLPLLTLLALSIACVPATQTSQVTSGAVNKNAPYLWSGSFPKLVYLSSAWDADETTAITSMSTAWYTALENKVQFFNHGSSTTPEKTNSLTSMDDMYDGLMGVYKTTNWPDDLPGSALAVTQIYGRRYNVGDSDEYVSIEHADILVNYKYNFYVGTGPNYSFSGYDLRSVVLHEMGHFLGLQHTANVQSIMVTTLSDGVAKRAPMSIDKAEIADKYHISVSSGSAATASTAPVYQPKKAGEEIRILIELHADGECVHRENGVVVQRHSAQIK